MKKNSEVANLIQSVRNRLKCSREELATRLNVHPRTVLRWETGDSLPRKHQLYRINGLAVGQDIILQDRYELSDTLHLLALHIRQGTLPADVDLHAIGRALFRLTGGWATQDPLMELLGGWRAAEKEVQSSTPELKTP